MESIIQTADEHMKNIIQRIDEETISKYPKNLWANEDIRKTDPAGFAGTGDKVF